ncbi:hypothetical protein CMI47_20825 [Candidatus Pacearchaeota archaeon]|nr:hypothetical protein [Candidatus Pacearchaeota archaeon]|tara:strand:- start:3598 stop:4044 length:447 start_codon:yes stop_codon:yes gene_type:complete
MKLSVFKKLIREVVREELDYSFSRLRKELNEIVVKSNSSKVDKVRTHTRQDRSLKNVIKKPVSSDTDVTTTKEKVSVPMTHNKMLHELLKETAQSDDWKTVEGKGEAEAQSVQDNTEQLPEHLANAFTKDYSQVMKKVDEKARFKNGA